MQMTDAKKKRSDWTLLGGGLRAMRDGGWFQYVQTMCTIFFLEGCASLGATLGAVAGIRWRWRKWGSK